MIVPVQRGPAGAAGPAGPAGPGITRTQWDTGNIVGAGGTATFVLAIGASAGSLLAIQVEQTAGAGAGSTCRVDIYDRIPTDPAAKSVCAIGEMGAGAFFPADLKLTGPGRISMGVQFAGAIGLIPDDAVNMYVLVTNNDAGDQTQFLDMWWIS